MQANDAMRILGSAAAMGLLGGGGALAYNATTKPIVDEYGNVIESNDIDPVMAALGGAAIGAVGGYSYGKMNQPVARSAQGINTGTSPQPQQSPDIVEPEVMQTQKIPRQDAEYPYETYWEQSSPDERTPGNPWDDIANAVDEVTDPEKVAQRNAQYEAEFARKQQAVYQESKQKRALEQERVKRQQAAIDYMEGQGYNTEYGEYRGLVRNEFGELVKPKKPFNYDNYGVEGWDYLETNLIQPTIQVVPASPMQMQNPMTPPGMRTVVVQPMKEPGQEMMEEALRLKELAYQQRLQNLAGLQGNPPNLVNEYFDPSPNVRTFVQDVYSPEEKYLYSQIGQKQYQNPDRVYQPRSDDEEMASMQWLRKNRDNYQAQKKMM